jgi:large subunit ribosomal protein L37Ae
MTKRTKKVGPAGRFSVRYGVRARNRLKNVEILQRQIHMCPSCGHQQLKRLSTGIWWCRKCGMKIATGAYLPTTEAGQGAEKILRGEMIASQKLVEEGEGEPEA